MAKCTCNKLDCDSTCLCDCHRDKEYFPELVELNEGLNRIETVIDICIERMQKFNLKK